MTTYFEALGLERTGAGVKFADVKRAYRQLAVTLHPDTNKKDEEKFKLISAAYHDLSSDEKIIDYSGRVKFRFLNGAERAWERQWNELLGLKPIVDNPFKAYPTRNSTMDDLERLIREQEARRRAARRMREEAERAKAQQQAKQAKAEKPKPEPKAGKCNHMTTSGPCCRPDGHTPNGHMSQKVADTKRANQRRRQQQG